ncbi:MAG: hypothetical protein IKV94_02150 [Clostridia bacterium]|nr:hypothetical protein [Clostridia bacterium]
MDNLNNDINNDQETNPLFDIIQNIQSKLNTDNSQQHFENDNFNVDNINNKGSNKPDLNNIMEMLKNVGIGDANTNFGDKTISGDNSLQGQNSSNLNLDLSTIMKFQRVFSSLNKTDPRKNLLTSLKPFLRKTRQKNIDTYITLLGIINALDAFSSKGE